MFVAPNPVDGTLARGFEIYRGLARPLHRAIFMMFLISEVHPFADGNGRVARVTMNAELVAAGENRIVIPTVFRNNCLVALKALSQNGITGALVRAMDFAQKYTAAVDFSEFETARSVLERTHAFADPNEADAAGIRFVLPQAGVEMSLDAARTSAQYRLKFTWTNRVACAGQKPGGGAEAPPYSKRRASTGFTDEARCAGTNAAPSAAEHRMTVAATIVMGSVAVMP